MNDTITRAEADLAIKKVLAVARELKQYDAEQPRTRLYFNQLAQKMSWPEYNAAVNHLIKRGLVTERSYRLKWVGTHAQYGALLEEKL